MEGSVLQEETVGAESMDVRVIIEPVSEGLRGQDEPGDGPGTPVRMVAVGAEPRGQGAEQHPCGQADHGPEEVRVPGHGLPEAESPG